MTLAPSSFAQYLGAGATLAAVCVALFRDPILKYWHRPILSARIDREPPDCLLSPMTVSNRGNVVWEGDSIWLRLWIQNNGHNQAEQVQVFVSKLYKRGPNDKLMRVPNFVPMNLRWSNSRDWNNPEIFAPGISRQPLGKHCDLCSVSDPANPTDTLQGYEGQCVGTLQLEVFPSGNRHRLPPDDYVLEVILGAANAEPKIVGVRLKLTGKWTPDLQGMFQNNLWVEIVDPPKG